jgi:glucose-6-phosphate 1-epimerase
MKTSSNEMTIPDRIALKTGPGGLRYLELRFNGAEAHLYLHGAHVLHYQPAGQAPVLWHSAKSCFEPGKPIRGGIPVCWPWFGAHPEDSEQPSHGVARLTEWEPGCSSATPTATTATLKLPSASFPNASLQLTVELSDHLSVTLTTTNTRDADLRFTEALHSYFSVQDVKMVTVGGLEGQSYIDQLASTTALHTQTGPISFSAETDRVYTDTPQTCTVIDSALNRSIQIRKENSLSTVVWNPWRDKAARMPDFGNDEFPEMVCVETANCGPNPVTLSLGQTHALRLQISAQNRLMT